MSEENKTTITLLAHEAQQEHAELHRLLEQVRKQMTRCFVAETSTVGRCLVGAMNDLRKHVEAHFSREETGGWLEEAVVRAPHLAHRLRRLERQHRPLRNRVRKLVACAEAFDGSKAAADALRSEFDTFERHLLIHEQNEERVLQKGFNEDLELD